MTEFDWRPGVLPEALRVRGEMLRRIRRYFEKQRVLEVETPALSRAATTDPHIGSIAATPRNGPVRYLQASPELAMKRLLAAGSGDIYQICRVFRDDESGALHNPEFTMLEYYRLGLDHLALMRDLSALLTEATADWIGLGEPEYLTYSEVFSEHVGCDPFRDSAELLALAMSRRGLDVPDSIRDDRDALMDLAMAALVSPTMGSGRLSFVYDFPPEQAALASIRRAETPVAERFEVFLSGAELANGFHELVDAGEQRTRFAAELGRRRHLGLPAVPVDERFLAALEAGVPACSGVAVGLDRLLMCITGADHIDQVLAFGWTRI